jgi:predicted SAM-dependent methyltransferase
LSKYQKLHLGCGEVHIPGFFHIDAQASANIDHVGTIDSLTFIPDEASALIYCSHCLEHFGRWQIPQVLQEWCRVLKPGGVLRLAVPNFAACAQLYYEAGLEDGLSGLVGLVSGGQKDEYDFHKMIFDEPLLTNMLKDAGFNTVKKWNWRDTEHAHIDDYSQAYLPHLDKDNGMLMSLNLEATK